MGLDVDVGDAVGVVVHVGEEDGVAWVTVDRPEVLNALNGATLIQLRKAFDALVSSVQNGSVRCVVVTGAGDKAFVAGADIKEMAGMGPASAHRLSGLGSDLAAAMSRVGVPIVAALGGVALGGGLELAMFCDLIVAKSGAKLGLPEVTLGVVPGFGGISNLVNRVGHGQARRLLFTGQAISAEEALKIGLVDDVVDPARFDIQVRALAGRLAAGAPIALSMLKTAVGQVANLPMEQALAYERELFGRAFSTTDQKEGMRAFLEKRKPTYLGR